MPQGCYKMAWGQPGCLSTLAQTGRHTPQFSVFCSVLFCFNYKTQAACVTSIAAGCDLLAAGVHVAEEHQDEGPDPPSAAA